MKAKVLSYLIGVVALLAAGAYVFIYLYRWEWNRAIMAGVIFIAAEIALIAGLVLDRLKSIENRLKEQPKADAYAEALDDIRGTAPDPKQHFAWLTDSDKLGVFVPVLMGAGVIMSGIAWLVERLAASTARPVLERRLVTRLTPLALPAGGLTGTSPIGTPIPPETMKRRVTRWVAGGLAVLFMIAAVDLLGDLTQNRPDPVVSGMSNVELEVYLRNENMGSPISAARSLWGACSASVTSDLAAVSRSGGRVLLSFEPALGKYSMRRLHGCFEDSIIDGLQARVTAVDL
ncbi:MAG: hypothetical protein M3280_06805 [Actinomycetota bacterium]|nr:hypothetical protein [Actinomycetota bacterium]